MIRYLLIALLAIGFAGCNRTDDTQNFQKAQVQAKAGKTVKLNVNNVPADGKRWRISVYLEDGKEKHLCGSVALYPVDQPGNFVFDITETLKKAPEIKEKVSVLLMYKQNGKKANHVDFKIVVE